MHDTHVLRTVFLYEPDAQGTGMVVGGWVVVVAFGVLVVGGAVVVSGAVVVGGAVVVVDLTVVLVNLVVPVLDVAVCADITGIVNTNTRTYTALIQNSCAWSIYTGFASNLNSLTNGYTRIVLTISE